MLDDIVKERLVLLEDEIRDLAPFVVAGFFIISPAKISEGHVLSVEVVLVIGTDVVVDALAQACTR